jgi:hypothetical protein
LFESVAEAVGKLSTTLMVSVGIAFLDGFWAGITESFGKMKDFVGDIINGLIDFFKSLLGINSPSTVMMEIGGFIIDGLLAGIELGFEALKAWFIDFPIKLLGWFASAQTWLVNKGIDVLTGLATGIYNKWQEVNNWFRDLGDKIKSAIGSFFTLLRDKGLDLFIGLKNGITEKWEDVKNWLSDVPEKIKSAIGSLYETLKTAGINLVIGFKNGIIGKWSEFISWLRDQVTGLVGKMFGWLGINSPSKYTTQMGEGLMEGLRYGLADGMSPTLRVVEDTTDKLKDVLSDGMTKLSNDLALSTEFNPTIRPVLDLSDIQVGATKISKLLPSGAYSYGQAAAIASTKFENDTALFGSEPTTVKFEQTINAPKQLSTVDIYRATRNQIEIAKEELGIR